MLKDIPTQESELSTQGATDYSAGGGGRRGSISSQSLPNAELLALKREIQNLREHKKEQEQKMEALLRQHRYEDQTSRRNQKSSRSPSPLGEVLTEQYENALNQRDSSSRFNENLKGSCSGSNSNPTKELTKKVEKLASENDTLKKSLKSYKTQYELLKNSYDVLH